MRFCFLFVFAALFIIACDNSPTKRVKNLAIVKITDSNERSQEFIVKYDTIRFSMANTEAGSDSIWGSQYLHKVQFYEDDAGQVILTLRAGYSFTVSPITTLGDVTENEARIRLQNKYNFDELAKDGIQDPLVEQAVSTEPQ